MVPKSLPWSSISRLTSRIAVSAVSRCPSAIAPPSIPCASLARLCACSLFQQGGTSVRLFGCNRLCSSLDRGSGHMVGAGGRPIATTFDFRRNVPVRQGYDVRLDLKPPWMLAHQARALARLRSSVEPQSHPYPQPLEPPPILCRARANHNRVRASSKIGFESDPISFAR
jgi:hypothetical protein